MGARVAASALLARSMSCSLTVNSINGDSEGRYRAFPLFVLFFFGELLNQRVAALPTPRHVHQQPAAVQLQPAPERKRPEDKAESSLQTKTSAAMCLPPN